VPGGGGGAAHAALPAPAPQPVLHRGHARQEAGGRGGGAARGPPRGGGRARGAAPHPPGGAAAPVGVIQSGVMRGLAILFALACVGCGDDANIADGSASADGGGADLGVADGGGALAGAFTIVGCTTLDQSTVQPVCTAT